MLAPPSTSRHLSSPLLALHNGIKWHDSWTFQNTKTFYPASPVVTKKYSLLFFTTWQDVVRHSILKCGTSSLAQTAHSVVRGDPLLVRMYVVTWWLTFLLHLPSSQCWLTTCPLESILQLWCKWEATKMLYSSMFVRTPQPTLSHVLIPPSTHHNLGILQLQLL